MAVGFYAPIADERFSDSPISLRYVSKETRKARIPHGAPGYLAYFAAAFLSLSSFLSVLLFLTAAFLT